MVWPIVAGRGHDDVVTVGERARVLHVGVLEGRHDDDDQAAHDAGLQEEHTQGKKEEAALERSTEWCTCVWCGWRALWKPERCRRCRPEAWHTKACTHLDVVLDEVDHLYARDDTVTVLVDSMKATEQHFGLG